MRPDQLAQRDGWVCWLCGGDIDPDAPEGAPASATVDHVVPRSRGGATSAENLRLAHRRCNGRRGNHLPELDWPDEFGLIDAPSLWRSLRHLVPTANQRRRAARRNRRRRRSVPDDAGIVVALAPTEETARAAGAWAADMARRFLGGTWQATVAPTGAADSHVVRLSVHGQTLDPGRPR